MTLFKRGEFWYYDFWFKGKRYRKSTKQREKREAEKIENAIKADLARRKFTLPSKSLPFSELCDKYMEVAKTKLRPASAALTYHIARNLRAHFGQMPVDAINADTFERYKRTRCNAGFTRSTIRSECSVLKAILKYAGQSALAPEALGAQRPKVH